jgi:sugar lactone lactonase YvrE
MLCHARSFVALAAIALLAGTIGSAQIPTPMPGTISTVAGNGFAGTPVPGSLAINSQFGTLSSVALDNAGDVFFADSANNQVFEINAKSGLISVVAGKGDGGVFGGNGSWGDGGPAVNATVSNPSGIAVDASGNLYISDSLNNLVRKVDASSGIITTVAGVVSGAVATGNPNLAVNAHLSQPTGNAVDSKGNLYIAESKSSIVEKVDVSTGIISTVAGDGTSGYSGDGGQAVNAQMGVPMAVAVDAAGNLYIADYSNNVVRRVAASSGAITTVAGTGNVANFGDPDFGDGGPAVSADLKWPEFLAVDPAGNIFISDYANAVVREVNAQTGIIKTVAGNGMSGYTGDGGAATDAEMRQPSGIAIGSTGNLYIADTMNYRLRVVATGAGSQTTPYVTVSSSDPKPTMAETVTLTATVVNGAGASVSGGQITWYDGNKSLGQSTVGADGTANSLVELSQAGSHSILASYAGTGANTGTLNLVVSGFSVSGNKMSANAPSGQTDTFTLNVNGFSGFTGTVDLACSGMPSPGACSLSASSATLTNGMTSVPVILTVTTMSTTTASTKTGSGLPAGMFFACLCPLFLLGSKRVRRSFLVVPLMLCAIAVGVGVSGCNASSTQTSKTPTTTVNRVPKGTYTVTITATSGINTVQVPITVIVNS